MGLEIINLIYHMLLANIINQSQNTHFCQRPDWVNIENKYIQNQFYSQSLQSEWSYY